MIIVAVLELALDMLRRLAQRAARPLLIQEFFEQLELHVAQ